MPFVVIAVLAFVTVVLLLLGGMAVAMVRIIKGGSTPDPQESSDETRLIQELHQGLSRMEQRIESLETILLEKDAPGGSQ